MSKISKEVKFDVLNFEILEKLRANKAVLVGGAKEITTRYDRENMALAKEGKFIRTKEGFQNVITLKEKKGQNNNIFEREETEVIIDDLENMQKILEALNVEPILIMEKYRLKWSLDGVQLNLDELPFGLFLEIHGEEDEIERIIEMLNLPKDKKIIKTYWDIYADYCKDKETYDKNIKFCGGYEYKLLQL